MSIMTKMQLYVLHYARIPLFIYFPERKREGEFSLLLFFDTFVPGLWNWGFGFGRKFCQMMAG